MTHIVNILAWFKISLFGCSWGILEGIVRFAWGCDPQVYHLILYIAICGKVALLCHTVLKIDQRKDLLSQTLTWHLSCVLCLYCLFGFAPSNQYCQKMRNIILTNKFTHHLYTTHKELHSIVINLMLNQ